MGATTSSLCSCLGSKHYLNRAEGELITVDDRARIRRAYVVERKSIRQLACAFQHSRKPIDKALAAAAPQPYPLTTPRLAPQLGPLQERIQALRAEHDRLPRKQRYTSPKLFAQIQAAGSTGSEARVRAYIGALRRATTRPPVDL